MVGVVGKEEDDLKSNVRRSHLIVSLAAMINFLDGVCNFLQTLTNLGGWEMTWNSFGGSAL